MRRFLLVSVSFFLVSCSVPVPGLGEIKISKADVQPPSCRELATEMRQLENEALGLVSEARQESIAGKAVTGFDSIVVWPALALLIEADDEPAFNALRAQHKELERRSDAAECTGPKLKDNENFIN